MSFQVNALGYRSFNIKRFVAEIPACKVVAFLFGICRSVYELVVVNLYNNEIVTVVSIKGYLVGVDFPRCRDSHVLCGHGCRNLYIPTIKGVTCLGRICGSGYSCSKIQRDSVNLVAAIGIESDGVLIYSPRRRDGHVLGRHSCRDSLIPICKGVALLGRICGSNDCCSEVLYDRSDLATAIGIESNGVLIDRPLCRDGHILCGHGCRDSLIPICKGVTGLGRICGSGDCCSEIQSDSCDLAAINSIKGNGVLVDRPLCRDGHILGRHGCGDLVIPTTEGVACLGRICGRGDCCSEIQSDSCGLAAINSIKGNGVLVDFPNCFDNYAFNGHGCGNFFIPTFESVTNLLGSCGSGNCRSEVLYDGSDLATAIGIEGDGVLIYSPSCLYGYVCGNCCFEIVSSFTNEPTCKGVACLGGSSRSSHGLAVLYCCCGVFSAVVGIEGYGVGVENPLSLERNICSNSCVKIISGLANKPTCKGITFLCRSGGRNCFASLLNNLTCNGRTAVCVKGYSISRFGIACRNGKNKYCNQKQCE